MSLESLPVEWYLLAFTDLLDVQGGTQPPKSEFIDQPHEGYIRLLQIRDFGSKPVPTYIPITKKLKTCQKDDILIARYGASLGRICSGMEGAYNVALAKVVTPLNIEKAFLKYFLRSDHFQQPLMLLSRSAQNGFNKEDLTKFPFILPALAEQQEIVRQLDVMLAQVEQIKARLDAIPAILKKFRQSVLASFFPEYPISNEYVTCTLKDICTSISDGDHQAPPKAQTGIPFLVISDVNKEEVNLESASRFVPQSYYDSLKDIRKPKKGDILYTVTGSFGIPIPLNKEQDFCFQRHIAILKLDKAKIEQPYLYYLLKSQFLYQQADQTATGTAQKTVALSSLRNFTVHIPSLVEQGRVIESIQGMFKYADTIEESVQSAQKRVNLLTQSILAKAFSGELTAEWREQHQELITGVNSAEALLAKIQAEREVSKPVKKTRAKKEA